MALIALDTSAGQFSDKIDLGALVAPYRPYSLTWLMRLRLGEIDMSRPARLRG